MNDTPTITEKMFNLSDGQKQCLRLVQGHLNSKEIGRQLDISPHTVDQRLRGAMRALEVNTRFEAARKFAEIENTNLYQPLIYQPSDIENTRKSASLNGSAKLAIGSDNILGAGNSYADSGLAETTFDDFPAKKYSLPIPRRRGEKNEMGTVERLGWIVIIAIGSALSFGGILSGLEALARLSE